MKYIPRANFPKNERILLCLFLGILVSSCNNNNKSGEDSSWFSSGETEFGSEIEVKQALASPEALELFKADSVIAFYEERDYAPAWQNDDLRKELLETFETAEDEGLYFEDYHGEKIQSDFKKFNSLSEQEKSNLDILLTDAFFKYGDHLLNGKLDPKDFHEIWDVPKNELNIVDLLNSVIEQEDLSQGLAKLRPNHTIYSQLMTSAKEYKDLSTKFRSWENIPEGEMIKHGQADNRIPMVQERLRTLGYLNAIDSTNTSNSDEVQKAIEEFQGANGLQSDGIIGNTTIELLNIDYDQRYEQILANLERWRWYPRDLGEHYIIVNIANYYLHVVKDNDTVRTHRTMVGTEARKTPVFSDKIEYIVFNPTWTIPPTIQNDDVIPGMRKNNNYLSSKNINVYDKSGNQVNPNRINWGSDDAKTYTYMQNPGASNPLGRVKIIYPNEYFIYLHDTPSQALFERNSRDQSSGCVRVEDAVELAKYLLSDQDGYSSKDIDEIIAKGETKQIEMEQEVQVHHFYWTAWRENESTKFTADIYNYDLKIFDALRKAS